MCTGCQQPMPTPGVAGPGIPTYKKGTQVTGWGLCCLPQNPRSSKAFLRQSARGPCSVAAQQCDLREGPHLPSPTCIMGSRPAPSSGSSEGEMSRPRAQDSVWPHERPAHGLAVGAASPARGWSMCLMCSPGGGETGGAFGTGREVEGTPHPRGKMGWGGRFLPQTPTDGTFAVGLPAPRAPRQPRCCHTALKGVSSLCPDCPLVLIAGLQWGPGGSVGGHAGRKAQVRAFGRFFWCSLLLGVWDLSSQSSALCSGSRES